METETALGKRALLAIINWNDEPVKQNLILKDILADTTIYEQYLIFDWLEERLLGCFSYNESLTALDIPPHSCRYLGIIPFEDQQLPLVLSSALHILQGCEEVKRIEISSNCIELTTCSEKLARQLQLILLRFKIRAHLRKRPPSQGIIKGKHNKLF